MNENNRSGGSMPKPPAANETVTQGAPLEEKVTTIDTGAKPPDSTIKVKPQKSGIPVTALRKGQFGSLRKVVGDKFLIPGKKAWGTWMKCDDKDLQEALVKERNEKIKILRQL